MKLLKKNGVFKGRMDRLEREKAAVKDKNDQLGASPDETIRSIGGKYH